MTIAAKEMMRDMMALHSWGREIPAGPEHNEEGESNAIPDHKRAKRSAASIARRLQSENNR
jgi:hypothetical protein